MANEHSDFEKGTEHWNRLYDVLSAQPRRMIIFSLLKEPEGKRLPLPDAAESATHSRDGEKFRVALQHHHLPKLSEPGYVNWERDPFTVQRGRHFAEPALIVSKMTEATEEYPRRLRTECTVRGEVH